MKIFLISNMYPSNTDALFGVFVKNFKEGLEKFGVNFSEQALIKGKSKSPIKKMCKYIFHYLKITYGMLKSNYDLLYVHYLTHHLPILYLSLPFKNKKWVINVHGSDIHRIKHLGKIDKMAIKVLKKVDLIVVPTSYFKELVLKKYPFLIPTQLYISPSGGINPDIFYVKENKELNQTLTLGFISRLIREKGWKTFLEAMVNLKKNNIPFRAIMAGKGPDHNKILEFIQQNNLGKEVTFLGLINQNKLVDIYNSLDLYVFPSYREAESLGLTGVEAMSCGVPVIACNIAGPSTYVKNNVNGYLFSPKDSDELTKIIKAYTLLDQSEKNNLIENSLKTSQQFTMSSVNMNLHQKLNQLLVN